MKKVAAKPKRKRAATETSPPKHERICNLVPSTETEKDWQFEDAVASGALEAVAAPPAKVDWRQKWWTIGDQENTGSCVGWATAEGVLRYHMVQAGKVGQSEPLSPRFVWMASKETDEFTTHPTSFIEGAGTSLKAAMDAARNYGVVTDKVLPFHVATKMYTGDENAFFADAAQRKISAYFNLQRNLTKWKSWLASHGPILAGVSVDATWGNATATKGILDKFQPGTVRGGHAIAVVGYLPNGRFIIRNSWGTGWGDKGFGYASPAYIAAAFFNESYGVTV
ncbi:MAG: C1 family peptidase [Candidatus Microthrix subdominans]|uniref:C1 family peptidase n=1 Tax=Candidatus Neomicrothrix sp. TaxID=2719034 RepID=UPI00259913F1|nr:C1 family peptidase [Candidatus Microthrix sp.]HMS48893.1 C1 family peptidase [Candidatus Microthrix sp.]